MKISIEELSKRLSQGEDLESIGRVFMPEARLELLKRLAAVRTFDEKLVDDFLHPGIKGGDRDSLPFADIVSLPAIERLPRTAGQYRFRDSSRQTYWESWWEEQPGEPSRIKEPDLAPGYAVPKDLQELSRRLVQYFLAQGPQGDLDRLYYLIAVDRDQARQLFLQLYDAVDQTFELAGCRDLLNILEERLSILGPELSRVFNDYRVYTRVENDL
jgi:hypothetical protein